MSQFIVPIQAEESLFEALKISQESDFNQIFFDDVFIPDELVVGEPAQRLGPGDERARLRAQRARAFSERVPCSAGVWPEYQRQCDSRANRAIWSFDSTPDGASQNVRLGRQSAAARHYAEHRSRVDQGAGNAYERLVPEAIRMHPRQRPPLIMRGC